MTSPALPTPAATFFPTESHERLDALDVLRGFALIGICVANVEFFNRSVAESGLGVPAGLHGLDWIVAVLVACFVSGKFWTIFSLLFGMGFALMLDRARQAGRPFLPVYGRRIGVLFILGLLHHSLLWSGDILISYAVGAVVLLLALVVSPGKLVACFVLCVALTQYQGFGYASWALAPIVVAGVAAVFLRPRRGLAFALLAVIPGILMLGAAFLASDFDRTTLAVTGGLLIVLSLLAWRHAEPVVLRPLRAGAVIVMLSFALIAVNSGTRYMGDPAASTAVAGADSDDVARYRVEASRSRQEERVLTSGSYAGAVAMRVHYLAERLRDEMGFSVLVMGVFLVGVGLMRSGIIARPAEHLGMLRRLALSGIAIGIGLGLAGAFISMGRAAGVDDPAYEFANALSMLGSLPAALGYMAAVLLMLHSRGALARIRLLAPFGRMALSNYLAQSAVFVLLFYGHGLGWWGMGRAAQVGIALLLCALQIALSHWWLARFRYGPVEWVWRALTYLTLPGLRRAH